MKNPWVVAVVNFLLPGLGYLMLRKKVLFGSLVLASTVAFTVWMFDPGAPQLPEDAFFFAQTLLGKFAELMWWMSISIAFAYDGYMLAKEKRENDARS